MNRKLLIKIIALFLILGTSVGLFFYYDLHHLFTDRQRLMKFIRDAGPWSIVVFIGLQALQVLFAPIPGEVTGFIGGYLYGALLGTLYSTIGLTIGSWFAFSLARYFGLPSWNESSKPPLLEKYDRFITHQDASSSSSCSSSPVFPKMPSATLLD